MAVEQAQKRGFNITLDGIANNSVKATQAKIDTAHKAGYRVNGYYVTVDAKTALARARFVDRRLVVTFPTTLLCSATQTCRRYYR